jgi:Electron transfer DM13
MKNRKPYVIAAVLVAGGIAWYAFRPERLFVNKAVSENLPSAQAATGSPSGEPVTLSAGRFHDGAHKTVGVATIYTLPEGKRVLRLTEFETSNGPDVQVYLVAANDATDSETVKKAGFLMLGPLKGNIGDQNYDLPEGVDLQKYRAVTIWCRRFGVNFGTAPLELNPATQAMMTSAVGAPNKLIAGQFHSVAHETSGVATIYQLPGGKRVLRLSNFKTSNGPEVQVYLVAANDATDSETVKKAGFVSLGPLKGNVGDQNYDVPADVDLAKYRAATIWCHRFAVNFGTAPLVEQN